VSGADPRLDPPPGALVRLAARAGAALFPLRARPLEPSRLRRVLVVRSDDRVGNALLTVPLARALAQLLPQARIDLLLPARRALAAEGLGSVHVLPFEKRDVFRHPLRFLRFLRDLREAGYDAAIDAAHWHSFSLTGALLARIAARGAVVGSARGALALYSQIVPLPPEGVREVEAKLLLLRGLGLAPPPAPPPLETALGSSPAARERTRAALRELGIAGPFVALNPGARKADHRWPARAFGALAAQVHKREGLPSVVLWGPGERPLAEEVRAASGTAAHLAPETDLEGLAAFFREAALVVANDTGPMHLAVACGAFVLALGMASDAERWSHPGPRFRLVQAAGDGQFDAAVETAASLAYELLALTPAGAQGSLRFPRRPE
jgi:ADP-heptose:LPS heptosyltransferase